MSPNGIRLKTGLTITQSVSEVAEQVGYLNQSKFAAVFKKHFMMSPLEYRKPGRLHLL
ncbi:helix-turn-helix domain-containing protein [Mediterraneibacter glycyrrhizinilyticus]|nr:helix-turn-helix domain-containing protein [Mediterraneibacter glycyrrhizinilyticus]